MVDSLLQTYNPNFNLLLQNQTLEKELENKSITWQKHQCLPIIILKQSFFTLLIIA